VITHFPSPDAVPGDLPPGVSVVVVGDPPAIAARLAKRFRATLAADVGVARRAVEEDVRIRAAEREARCRLVGARVDEVIAASVLPHAVVAATGAGVRARAAAVTLADAAARAAEDAIGPEPPFDAAASVAVEATATTLAAATADRTGRRGRFLAGLARGKGVGMGLLGAAIAVGGLSGADFSSGGPTTLVGTATLAPLAGFGLALSRYVSAARREESARATLARALDRAGVVSREEMAVRRAAHDAWAAAADAARAATANAADARRAWQDFVGSARRVDGERWLAAADSVGAAEAVHAQALAERDAAESRPPLVVLGDGDDRVATAVAGVGVGRPVIVVGQATLSSPVRLRRLARFARRRAS